MRNPLILLSFLALATTSSAQSFTTDFESPAFAAGQTATGRGGWVTDGLPDTALAQSITTATAAGGSQSLMWDNTSRRYGPTVTGYLRDYSIKRPIALTNNAAYTISTKVRIDGSTSEGRDYGIYLSGGTQSPPGPRVPPNGPPGSGGGPFPPGSGGPLPGGGSTYRTFGVTLNGRGMVGVGGPIGNPYFGAFATPGSFKDRWLTMSLFFYGDGRAMAQVTGFSDGSYRQIAVWNSMPAFYNHLHLGTVYEVVPTGGKGYFDDVSVQSGIVGALPAPAPVPEPASMAALGLGALGLLRRRRRARR